MFNPTRLQLARKRRGFTKKRLAETVGVAVRSISEFENKLKFSPSEETVEEISKVLNFPTSFFYGETLDQPTPETASFRALRSMRASVQHAVLSSGALAFNLNDWIERHFDLPPSNLPNLNGEEPETAAMIVRHQWGLGESPIKNMIHLLEAMGVRVYSLTEDTKEADAYSQWYNGASFVFLNNAKSGEHMRFTAAHELGHLVLHQDSVPDGKKETLEVEKQANKFASAFLMPRQDILAASPNMPTRESLISFKKRWGVSVMALSYRMRDVGLLSEWHYRNLCIEMSQRGDRTNEPSGMAHESSKLLGKVFSALRSEGISKSDIANELMLYSDDLDRLVFGLTPTLVVGNKNGEGDSSSPSRANLRLVK